MLTQLFLRVAHTGSEWVLWVLLALSFISVGVIIDRILYFRNHNVDGDELAKQLDALLRAGDLKGAYALVHGSESVACVVVASGLVAFNRGAHACEEAMAAAKARTKGELDRGLAIVASIASNAPFIGLLGTVLGIIKAAHDLTGGPAGEHDPTAVMAGVFEALIATAFGLCVAIPAVVSYNFFNRKVRASITQVDALAHEVLAHQKAVEHAPAASPRPGHAPAPQTARVS